MKISYSTMPNLNQQIISNNNKKLVKYKIQIYKLWQAVTVETKTPVKVKA